MPAYRVALFRITLNDFEGHSPIASLFECDFSCSCAAADKISTDIARRAVSLRFCDIESWIHCDLRKKDDTNKCVLTYLLTYLT